MLKWLLKHLRWRAHLRLFERRRNGCANAPYFWRPSDDFFYPQMIHLWVSWAIVVSLPYIHLSPWLGAWGLLVWALGKEFVVDLSWFEGDTFCGSFRDFCFYQLGAWAALVMTLGICPWAALVPALATVVITAVDMYRTANWDVILGPNEWL